MANHVNIVNVADITGRTVGASLTTVSADLITGSTSVITKINSVYVSNIIGTQAQTVTLKFYDSTTSLGYYLAKTVSVPANSTLLLISKNEAIYLEEGDKLQGLAGANSHLEVVISYEEIS